MKAKKSFGQNWLRDQHTLDLIVDSAAITSNDTILEVGPGLGTLTLSLSKKAGKVVTIEADQELVPTLKRKFLNTNVDVIQNDILKFDLNSLPANYKVVANIPYYLTSNLIRTLLESPNPPSLMVLLIQKEVAERIVARPGQMSVLAFSVQYYASAKIIAPVSRELFEPVPKVDSAIIRIERTKQPAFNADTKILFQIVRAGFSEKRKTLRNSLSGGLHIGSLQAEELLSKSGISLTARAQELSLGDWQKLYTEFDSTK